MQDLIKKIEEFRELIKALGPAVKSKAPGLVPALKPMSLKPITMPSTSVSAPSKLPGVAPTTTKDPKKMAEQLKNPRPTKPSMEILKVESNGQWSLEKVQVPGSKYPPAANNPNRVPQYTETTPKFGPIVSTSPVAPTLKKPKQR